MHNVSFGWAGNKYDLTLTDNNKSTYYYIFIKYFRVALDNDAINTLREGYLPKKKHIQI